MTKANIIHVRFDGRIGVSRMGCDVRATSVRRARDAFADVRSVCRRPVRDVARVGRSAGVCGESVPKMTATGGKRDGMVGELRTWTHIAAHIGPRAIGSVKL
ncbi:hypothetical protein JS533_001030 [Bifidobacterium amazonense]|uniref:Uncharacterized protein n=1 Tax=Bifidobacterium amazonense TaxID=2809027 RepID=A0ABS9VS11_9BIFI|nr:hypothetical protein [Bifidobacterium amazonense]MCH9274872.1 hypothetical protein [Bifidobacterium amazonense]